VAECITMMKRTGSMALKVTRYLSYRRSLGYELKSEGKALADFARFVDQLGHRGPLTLTLALEWARLPAKADPGYWARRLDTLRGLAKYLLLEDPNTEVPPLRMLGPAYRRKAPHIYSSKEIVRLLRKAQRLPQETGLEPITIHTLIGLLACTGIRVSEALRLREDDVDLKNRLITVRESKFRQSRLIPIHSTVAAKLSRYARRRRRDFPCSDSFFVSRRGTALPYSTIQRTFRELVEDFPCRGDRPRPRIHDLRHTYACRILIRWSKHPVILDQRVLWLMHYLGHTHIGHTYWYLSAVPQLLAQAAAHFEKHSKRIGL
jgi:integrase